MGAKEYAEVERDEVERDEVEEERTVMYLEEAANSRENDDSEYGDNDAVVCMLASGYDVCR